MFDTVRDLLIDDRYRKLEGYVSGYTRLGVRDEVYPGLVASKDSQVDGVVLLDVNRSDIQLLDEFEGEHYCRQGMTVICGHRQCIHAQAYIFRDEYRFLLTDNEWDADQFCNKDIQTFLSRYRGFNRG